MAVTETMRSVNGRRTAVIMRINDGYEILLSETRRLGSSQRGRKAPTKTEAREIARQWVRR